MSSSAESANRRRIAGERRKKAAPVQPDRSAGPVVAGSPDLDEPLDAQGDSRFADPGEESSSLDKSTLESTDESTLESTDEAESDEPVAGASRAKVYVAAAALLLALVLLAVTAGVVLRPAGPSRADATAALGTARTSLAALLSFDAKTVTAQPAQVAPLLTGKFKQDFTDTMTKDIAPLAVKNGSIVKANVVEIGVQSQTDTSVTVQAFVNQTRTSTTSPDPTIDQNRVLATLTKVDGRWLISDLKAY